jgi:hypothetical protein
VRGGLTTYDVIVSPVVRQTLDDDRCSAIVEPAFGGAVQQAVVVGGFCVEAKPKIGWGRGRSARQ